ncbi:bifunctional nicotinamide-nucleotide adenylyltransferase/Nudix hydroxylase [Noviherbaspirillum sedimenti]|uniref:Bifunctional nicotinamide-nucleotide adenylyltransferase/Nudix hydroxylase n=1 Tax=Noviherbaspirillum sedimenti TaxID=2320865 RepID=A0A3A3G3U3_9BURK|nr:bifunctional nicotinamide-nucleotide adenylyltransferase/Nudix hydroxylase [Noviherbaspirillum sedimenti]RJG02601.1 bifunctional nicotinamide-nucleotide adenylyltransferase/Nudix hydroxylase [Noviherbaspirillum sedimenti]
MTQYIRAVDATADLAVLIGRFQPFHNGHAALLRRALDTAPRVAVVLGSSWHARSARNPFNWRERAAMIAASLSAPERARVEFIPLRDYYDDGRWSAALRRDVDAHAGPGARIALVGHFKDDSSYYLSHFPQWQLIAAENAGGIDATAIRRILFEAGSAAKALAALESLVPPAVWQALQAWLASAEYGALAEEYLQVAQYKAAWSVAPYPPIFSTVDAVVTAIGHVLLIRRGGFLGKGQWALPGGFVEPRERLLQSALRELAEETRLAVAAPILQAALREVKVFDHPDRSQRGRTITHAHFFILGGGELPAVEAADDAAQARWLPIVQLAGMEEEFFEDHFHILDRFLHLLNE